MKVLGIVGSPRKGGNTDILVSQVLKGMESKGALQEKIYLDDLQMRPCKACSNCQTTGECIIDDDFHIILKKLKEAQVIVIGSPIYCRTVTAQTKILIDRVESSQLIKSYTPDGRVKLLRRIKEEKKGIIICIGDLSPKEVLKEAAETIQAFLKDIRVNVVAHILKNKLSVAGDVLKNKLLLQSVFAIGTSLVE